MALLGRLCFLLLLAGIALPAAGQQPQSPPTLGMVATRAKIPDKTSPHRRSMSRTYHYARDDIAELQVVFANWYGSPGAESGTGARATVRAAIEYPEGTFTRVLFSNAASGAIPDGAMVKSDPVRVAIPRNAKFFVRTFWDHPQKIVFAGRQDRANGDAWRYGDTILDQTMGGTIGHSDNDLAYFPVAIVANTRAKSVYILGDSRAHEEGDRVDDGSGDQGNVARSIGPAFGYVNAALAGETFATFLAANKQRRILAGYATHIVGELAINDLSAGVTAETLKARLAATVALFPGKPVFWTTAEPTTLSADGWKTVANQTLHRSHAQRVLWNNYLRSRPKLLAGYFDLADAAESARDSGRFKAPVPGGHPVMTEDGVHLTMGGYIFEKDSGAIDVRQIR